MGRVLKIMSGMIEKYIPEEIGVFVMGRKTVKEFRRETGRFSGEYLGHKVRTLNACPDDKVYLMSNEEYIELKYKLESQTKQRKKLNESAAKTRTKGAHSALVLPLLLTAVWLISARCRVA